MMAKPILKDVALDAGVSVATASLVLSGKGNVSSGVRKKVLESAKHVGYIRVQPKRISSRSHRIVVLTYITSEWSYVWNLTTPIISELEKAVVEQGYSLTIQPVTGNTTVDELYQMIVRLKPAGLASIHYVDKDLFSNLENSNIPIVIINNSLFQNQFHSVCVDDYQGAYDGASHLMNLGHKNFLFLEYIRTVEANVIADRFFGFRKAVEEHGIHFPDENRITVPFYDIHSVIRLMAPFFEKPKRERPTAIYSHDDRYAAIVIKALSGIGISVPEDVSLIATGDVLDYELPVTPGITTMKIDSKMLGAVAGDHLIKIIKNEPEIYGIKIVQRLIDRGSCSSV
ncbi:MAG: LacI family DNA-binding transcriptional regulator [Spirochaetales bacterium]|nr:LacI family DNA-binding transcriptional regulator [Spirochaetales bacterium]